MPLRHKEAREAWASCRVLVLSYDRGLYYLIAHWDHSRTCCQEWFCIWSPDWYQADGVNLMHSLKFFFTTLCRPNQWLSIKIERVTFNYTLRAYEWVIVLHGICATVCICVSKNIVVGLVCCCCCCCCCIFSCLTISRNNKIIFFGVWFLVVVVVVVVVVLLFLNEFILRSIENCVPFIMGCQVGMLQLLFLLLLLPCSQSHMNTFSISETHSCSGR